MYGRHFTPTQPDTTKALTPFPRGKRTKKDRRPLLPVADGEVKKGKDGEAGSRQSSRSSFQQVPAKSLYNFGQVTSEFSVLISSM